MRSLIKQLAPDRFEDLMALVALYRPGPLSAGMHVEYAERKHGRRPVSYPHAVLEEILAPTYGIMVYQEQVMQIAVRMAGYSMAEADMLRQAMGKKIRAKLMVQREKFIQGCVDNGYPDRLGTDLFDLIEPFADYGFNASHACAYGYIAYQTAYLKAHHPVEYMSAILTSVRDDKDRKPFYLNACRLMGLEVLPPDVNESELDFAPVDERRAEDPVRPVRGPQRGCGRGAADHRGAADEGFVHRVRGLLPQGGPVGPHQEGAREPDLRGRVRLVRVPRAAGSSRTRTRSRSRSRPSARPRPPGSSRCSAGGEQAAQRDRRGRDARSDEFDKRTLLRLEKEVLGQFVTDHPLLGREGAARRARRHGDRRDSRASATATWSRSRGSSPRSRAATRRRASPTRSSASRTWPAA